MEKKAVYYVVTNADLETLEIATVLFTNPPARERDIRREEKGIERKVGLKQKRGTFELFSEGGDQIRFYGGYMFNEQTIPKPISMWYFETTENKEDEELVKNISTALFHLGYNSHAIKRTDIMNRGECFLFPENIKLNIQQ